MHVNTNCKHFNWKNAFFVSENKINQSLLKQPSCKIKKLNKFLSCPDKCRWFEKR